MADSVYIHIPFCKSKCKYCSFISFINVEKINNYIKALIREIDKYYKGESLKTLYFGGGTPSLLKTVDVKTIIDKFKLNSDCEVTFEINPDDANEVFFTSLKEIGITRISMGSQTFDDKVLEYIGRRHTSEQTIQAVKLAKKVGFDNISLDLIYGLPFANIKSDLEKIIELEIPHVSTYGLKIEEGSYFYNHYPEQLPDDDMQADMYLEICETLSAAGFYRYEISNFSKKGYESKHNLNYWNNAEYYGFGVAAHGYIDGKRYANSNSIEKYIQNPLQSEYEHIVTPKERLEEEIFLGFRKESGIDVEKIKQELNVNFEEKYAYILDKYSPRYIVKSDCGYKLTTQGILTSNFILSEFL